MSGSAYKGGQIRRGQAVSARAVPPIGATLPPPTARWARTGAPGGPPSSAARRAPAAQVRSWSQGTLPPPGGRWRSSCRGSIGARLRRRGARPGCRARGTGATESSTGSTSVVGLHAHEAGDHVGVPDVEQHRVGAAVEPVHEVADRERVVADGRAARVDRAEVLEADGHAQRLGRARQAPQRALLAPPTRCRAAGSRARGRRRGWRRSDACTRAGPRRRGSAARCRAGGSVGPCTTTCQRRHLERPAQGASRGGPHGAGPRASRRRCGDLDPAEAGGLERLQRGRRRATTRTGR